MLSASRIKEKPGSAALREELGYTAGGFRYVGARKWGWGVHAAAEQRLSLPDFRLPLGDPSPLQHRTRGGGESSGGFPGADRDRRRSQAPRLEIRRGARRRQSPGKRVDRARGARGGSRRHPARPIR